MGSSLSTSKSDSHKFTLLIGKLDNKSQLEQKFYMLSKSCLLLSTSTCTSQITSPQLENDVHPNAMSSINATERDEVTKAAIMDQKIQDQENSEKSFFTPILGTKSLWLTQTYRSWHAITDVEKIFYRNRKTIYLVQLDEMPDFIKNFTMNFGDKTISLFKLLQMFIESFYDGMTVKWLENINMKHKKWKITSRIHKKTQQKQYLVKDIFPYLKKLCPSDGYGVMALIWTDLYPSEDMNFILGEASNQQKACVVSFGRWEPKGFDPEIHKDVSVIDTHVLWKLLKTCSHELGHVFGLNHCDYFRCMMNESTSVPEAMSQPMFLCPVCVRKVQNLCHFNILQRYIKLMEFVEKMSKAFPSQKWTNSYNWLCNIVQYLSEIDNCDLVFSQKNS